MDSIAHVGSLLPLPMRARTVPFWVWLDCQSTFLNAHDEWDRDKQIEFVNITGRECKMDMNGISDMQLCEVQKCLPCF